MSASDPRQRSADTGARFAMLLRCIVGKERNFSVLLIEQGMIHPMTGAAWQGDLLVENGRILRMEKRVDPTTQELETVLDARGLHIWPGLLDANTQLGLTEENPQRADPADAAFAQAAAAGVTVVEVCPASGTPAPRRCALWQTGSAPRRLDKPEALLYPMEGMTEEQLRSALTDARAQGRRVKLQAGSEAELTLALRLWKDDGGAMTLEHRAPTTAMTEEIARSGMPVIVGVARKRGEGSAYSLAARLMKLGATVAMSTDHPTARIHHLPLCAGLCLRYGVEEQAAMAAVTCNAARAMGLEEEWGTLAPGMRADLVLLDGSPLRLATAVRYTFIGGQKAYER